MSKSFQNRVPQSRKSMSNLAPFDPQYRAGVCTMLTRLQIRVCEFLKSPSGVIQLRLCVFNPSVLKLLPFNCSKSVTVIASSV